MNDFDDYILDDEEFAKTAGVSVVSDAWKNVFSFIATKATELSSLAESGAVKTKQFRLECQRLIHATAKVGNILDLQSGLSECYNFSNTLNIQIADGTSNSYEHEDDAEIIKHIQKIQEEYTTVSLSDAKQQIERNKKNIENDGNDHGDIDDIAW